MTVESMPPTEPAPRAASGTGVAKPAGRGSIGKEKRFIWDLYGIVYNDMLYHNTITILLLIRSNCSCAWHGNG